MSNSHKQSRLILSKQLISVDENTTFLAHYDITENDVLRGIEPHSSVVTLRDGHYGGGVAVEEGTTNLWAGKFNIYNNYASNGQMTASLIALNETYMGDTIYRLAMTPISSNALTSMKNDLWSHGVYGSHRTYESGNTYMSSIYWRPISHSDISVGGTASNIAGWSTVGTYEQNDGWNRSVSKWYDTTTRSDNKFWSYRTPSAELNKPVIIDWVAPQIERKQIETSFTKTSRGAGILSYDSKDIINPDEGTISFWYKPTHDTSSSYGSQNYSPKLLQVGSYHGIGSFSFWNINNSLTLYVRGENSTGWTLVRNLGNILVKDKWEMFAISWNGTSFKIYRSGALVSSGESQTRLGNISTGRFYVGGDGGDGGGAEGKACNGIIDELRIDKIERTHEEIEGWYISQLPFYPKGIYRLAY
jgi:hypothetical protein